MRIGRNLGVKPAIPIVLICTKRSGRAARTARTAKAFDKLWHDGLRYTVIQMQLPDIITKPLSSFLLNRTASISTNNHTGIPFSIRNGVPQGNSLSPTLYSIYVSDIPFPSERCFNIMYADDITQIITHPRKSRMFMTRKTEREIAKINSYETKWKIKTNTTKLKIVPLAITKTQPIIIEGNIIPCSKEGNLLGIHFNRRGIQNHIKEIKRKSTTALNVIRRFSNLPTNIKLHLVKACVIPILTYPSYPLAILSKTSLLSLQKIQNKALRFAFNQRYPYTHSTEELHIAAEMGTINITIPKNGVKIRDKIINILEDEVYIQTVGDTNRSEHGWFKRAITQINKNLSPPIYSK